MNERDRLALRQHRAEIEAEEAAEREARERPIREATEQAQELHRRIYNTIRERLLTMADVDELGGSLAYIAPDLCNISCRRVQRCRVSQVCGRERLVL
jgi:hypothetical protein